MSRWSRWNHFTDIFIIRLSTVVKSRVALSCLKDTLATVLTELPREVHETQLYVSGRQFQRSQSFRA